MKPRLYYDNHRRAYYLQWDADSDHIGRQEPVFERTREYIESLEAENARLQASNEVIAEDHAALCEQNAKLRELVRELYEYRQLYFKTGIYPTDHGVTERRMRELGVEADG